MPLFKHSRSQTETIGENDGGKSNLNVNSSGEIIDQDLKINRLEWLNLKEQVDELARTLEKINLTEYLLYLNNPKKLLIKNFSVGIMRGLGATVGAAAVLALLALFLKRLVVLNLPVIGGLIAELLKIVNANSIAH